MQQLKKLVKDVVRVVSPVQPASGVATSAVQVSSASRPDAQPVRSLDHVPGIDKVIYGRAPEPGPYPVPSQYTVEVSAGGDGRRLCRVFFLCGHPRSGTHWMDGVMSRHPRVFMDGEYRFEALRNATDDLTGRPWHAASREPMKSEAERCFADSVRRIVGASAALRPTAEWLGDRTPRVLKVFLQGAPHFLILRDGRDVLVSWAHQEFKNGGFNYRTGGFDVAMSKVREAFLADPDFFRKNPHELFGHEPFLRRLLTRWQSHVRFDLESLRRIDADEPGWSARVYVVRYEKIHADPEGERERMYRFLGLNPSEAQPLDEASKTRPGIADENPHALYRKGKVGDWVQYFTPNTKQIFKEIGGGTLIELGYESDHEW